ncbi:MAG: N-acetylmuramoyl-L-alanine amidase [Pyrinomonadaceae bacterium]
MSRATANRTLRSDGKIRAFVIHATAGASSSGAMSVMFAHRASWHWLVPDENEPEHERHIWSCADESRAAFHVRSERSHPDVNNGSRNVNFWSLGVEVVNTQTRAPSRDPFSAWQIEQTAALVRYAWSKNPELTDVVSHAKLDPSRRSDPGENFDWERFQSLVLSAPPPSLSFALAASEATLMAEEPIRILSPQDEQIQCNPRLIEGVTMVEARPLLEALGYRISLEEPMTMLITEAGRGGGSTAGGTKSAGTKTSAKTGKKAAKRGTGK